MIPLVDYASDSSEGPAAPVPPAGGATPAEALTFFADDIRYEDFNYYEPFVGLDKVPFVELHNPFTLPSPTKGLVVVHNL